MNSDCAEYEYIILFYSKYEPPILVPEICTDPSTDMVLQPNSASDLLRQF